MRCPTYSYYCNLPWSHSGDHSTRHGNMRKTYFVSDQEVFTVGSKSCLLLLLLLQRLLQLQQQLQACPTSARKRQHCMCTY